MLTGKEGSSAGKAGAAAARSELLDALNELAGHFLAVTIEHAGVVGIEQRIFHAREAGTLSTLDDNDIFGMVGIEDRHAVDRTFRIAARDRIDDIIRADDQCGISRIKFLVDFIQVKNTIIRNAGLGQQHIHMPGHASGDRMDRELDINTIVNQVL